MHCIKPHETAVTLFGANGEVFVFASRSAALRELGYAWINRSVGRHFIEFAYVTKNYGDPYSRKPVYRTAQYIMRDDFGGILTSDNFASLVKRRRHVYYWPLLLEHWQGVGSVPGISRRQGGHYFRHPKTMQERRWAAPVIEDGEPAPRVSRHASNLPSARDDLRIAARCDRSWKRYRKTQWKS